jgi:hypothetical protein
MLTMKKYAISLLALLLAPGARSASAQTTSGFTISATNITLPASGNGSIPITLTAVNGYTGIVLISCPPVTPPPGVLEPYCDPPHFGPVLSLVLNASNPTATANLSITSEVEPASTSLLDRPGGTATTAWVLAGALMLGLGFKRRRTHWLAQLLIAVVALVTLTGLGACAGGSNGNLGFLTPGTYTYTISAADQSNPQKFASTTVQVIVPHGVPVQQGP